MKACEHCKNSIPVFREYVFVTPPQVDDNGRQIVPIRYLNFCSISCASSFLNNHSGYSSQIKEELQTIKEGLEAQIAKLEARIAELEGKIKSRGKIKSWDRWNKEDDQKLIKFYHEGKSLDELAEIFGKTKIAISSRLQRLGIKRKIKKTREGKVRKNWSEEEENLLRNVYSKSSWEELMNLFPGRSKISISRKATKLKLRRSYESG